MNLDDEIKSQRTNADQQHIFDSYKLATGTREESLGFDLDEIKDIDNHSLLMEYGIDLTKS